MQDGPVCFTGSPAGLSLPVLVSIPKTATLLPGMFAQRNHAPSAVIARFCGPLPRLDSIAMSVNFPSPPIW